MLFVSDTAKEKINSILKEEGADESSFVRVSVKSGGCSGLSYDMTFDTEDKEGDEVFEHNGVKVVTDVSSLLYLINTTLDFSGGLNGKGFFFDNPNASRTCGCGESFSV